jgi:MOSC domain-containing protein YiiM
MSDAEIIGRLVSVNVGQPRTVSWYGRKVKTAIWKAPVDGPVAVRGVNLDGDEQADHRVHGGYDKAVYAYATEDYHWWNQQLGSSPAPLGPGAFGDNLTTEGVDLSAAVIGERWLIGSATFEVSEPRLPCYKLGVRMADSEFVDRFDQARRFGTYLRIVVDGEVTAGDAVGRLTTPDASLTIGDLVEAHHRPTAALLGRVAASAEVPEPWRAMAERALLRSQGPSAR